MGERPVIVGGVPVRPIVVLRADGGASTGLGHVRRALALVHAITSWADGRLLLGGDADTVRWVRGRGVPCDLVAPSMDATLAAVHAARADALVIDTYGFSARDLEAARAAVRLLVVVDDLGQFPIPAHLVVNAAGGLHAPRGAAEPYLLGPRFGLLGPEFAEPPARKWREQIERALLVLGGAPPSELMTRLAAAVRQALPEVALDIVVGPAADQGVVRGALRDVHDVTLHDAPEDMRGLMLASDVAVTAGGVTLLELAATATPMVGVCVVANQQANLLGLADAKALLFAGAAADAHLATMVEKTLVALRCEVPRRRRLGERARRLVDGRGAERVGEVMHAHLAATNNGARG